MFRDEGTPLNRTKVRSFYLLKRRTSMAQAQIKGHELVGLSWKAGNGTRTRDLLLGKQALYQLSYTRTVPR